MPEGNQTVNIFNTFGAMYTIKNVVNCKPVYNDLLSYLSESGVLKQLKYLCLGSFTIN